MEIFISEGVDYMSPVTEQIVNMIDMLPEHEQNLAYEFRYNRDGSFCF